MPHIPSSHLNRRTALGSLVLAATLLVPSLVQAQSATYPSKAIELIVPFAAGGTTDVAARILAPALEARWKVPVRVINRPGGNTVPAVNEVMTAQPDGHTLLMDNPPQSSMLEIVVKQLPFKVMDRSFIGMFAQTPMMIIVPYDSPFKTLADAAAAFKADPTKPSWTSLGGAGAQDLTFRQFFKALAIDVTKTRPVQLKGGSEAVTLTAGGHVSVGVATWSSIAAPLSAKHLQVLAVAASERYPEIPDVPTTVEAGFPHMNVLYWTGVSGPPGLPPEVAQRWDAALKELTGDPAFIQQLARVALVPFFMNASGMRDFVSDETKSVAALWAK
ncbi:tripartite tricarboxylate transporter substrate binding protein [Aquabacter sp. CN5-332]|uniref:tripartite tricarboxylate transporter substrate binding protein n=1 Tax=Aquabacter sp. CN5-332 TaxID=3156608 RepID=UPI0032B55486